MVAVTTNSDDCPLDYQPLPPKGPLVVVWWTALLFLTIHLVFLFSIYLTIFSIKLLTTAWALSYGFIGLVSITIGAHRLFAHRSFKAHPLLRLALVLFFPATGQRSTFTWVRNHRLHHKYTETDADPHNAQRGFFYSHVGWLMCRKQPDVIEKELKIDMSDLEAEPSIMFQKKFTFAQATFGQRIPYLVSWTHANVVKNPSVWTQDFNFIKRYYYPLYLLMGIFTPMVVPWLLWEETLLNSFMSSVVFRTVLGYNITWCVNSVAHMYGTRPYTREFQAVESPVVSLLSWGEGWHNYHHTFPWDYRASEFGHMFNLSTAVIDLFHKLGWVWDLRQTTPEMVHHRVLRHGDGTHPTWGTTLHTK